MNAQLLVRRLRTTTLVLAITAMVGCKPSPDPCAQGSGEGCPAPRCDGCLVDGRCEPGTRAEACGEGGGACTACGAGDVCSQGQCGLKLDALWQVTPAEAALGGATAEVELITYCPSTHTRGLVTTPQTTLTPTWTGPSCTMTAGELLTQGFDFVVYQGLKKAFSRQRVLPTRSDLETGTITIGPIQQVVKVVYKFQPL